MICVVYSEHLHRNYVTHLGIGVADHVVWQRCWKHIKNLPMRWYNLPLGRLHCRFVKRLVAKIKGVQLRDWNIEYPIVFVAVTLPIEENYCSYKDTRAHIVVP